MPTNSAPYKVLRCNTARAVDSLNKFILSRLQQVYTRTYDINSETVPLFSQVDKIIARSSEPNLGTVFQTVITLRK